MAGKSLSLSLASFFPSLGKKHRDPSGDTPGTTASGFPRIIPSILRYNPANDVVVGRLPSRLALQPSFPHGNRQRNLPLSLILRPRGTSRARAYFSRTLLVSRLEWGAQNSPYDLGYYALVIGPVGKSAVEGVEGERRANGLP